MTRSRPGGQTGREAPGVRERILDAALEVLGEEGLGGFTQVSVSERAGVRQSHLTYYFPTRDHLLTSVTERVVDRLACGVQAAVAENGGADRRVLLERLAASITELPHMRMFVGLIVEADKDPSVREIMAAATGRMEKAVAEWLGGEDAVERARVVLASAWGLGLYHILVRPGPDEDPMPRLLSWLSELQPWDGSDGG